MTYTSPPHSLSPMTVESDYGRVAEAREQTPVLTHTADDFEAVLYPVSETDTGLGYMLWWTDYVINEWAEFWPTLPTALARMGLLIDAGERGAFFHRTEADFAADARTLFDAHAEDPFRSSEAP